MTESPQNKAARQKKAPGAKRKKKKEMGIATQVRLFYEKEAKLKLNKASAEARKITSKASADAKKITSKASADAKQAMKEEQKKSRNALEEEKKKAKNALKKAERKAKEELREKEKKSREKREQAEKKARKKMRKEEKKVKQALAEKEKKAREDRAEAEREARKKMRKEEKKAKKALQEALDKKEREAQEVMKALALKQKEKEREAQEAMKALELKQKEKRDREESAKKKKITKALGRLKEDLRSPTKQVQFGGISGKKGRAQKKRVLYDPSGTPPPKKAKKPKATKAPKKPTADVRFAVANDLIKGVEEAKDKENQCNVIEFMKNVADPSKTKEEMYKKTKGLLVAHGMGSGKTLTSLWVAKEYVQKGRVDFVNILAPNVSVGEFKGSFERAGISPHMARKIRVLTHTEFSQNTSKRDFRNCLVIVDEAHLFTMTKYTALEKLNVPYIMLLSGTPAPNTPSEIVPLINLLCTQEKDKWTEAEWNKQTTKESEKIRFLKDKVSVYNIGSEYNYMGKRGALIKSANNFPGYKVTTRDVKLSQHQNDLYLDLLKRIKKEPEAVGKKYPFKTRERAIVDSKHGKKGKKGERKVTPKVARVAEDIVQEIRRTHKGKKGATGDKREFRGRLLLYATHKEVTKCLMKEIKSLCREEKVDSPQIALYNGDTGDKERLAMKESFNNGELDLLIISKAGSVGLDLQCTSKVFLYDLWWNIPQVNQIIGRAIRFRSHHKPPCKHKHVDVYIYKSSFATKPPGKGVERVFDHQVLLDADKKWTHVADMIENVLKRAAIKNVHSCKR